MQMTRHRSCCSQDLHVVSCVRAAVHRLVRCFWCCRQLQQLSTSDAAGRGSSVTPDAQQASLAQHADQVAAAQRACEQALANSANLENTVDRLTSGVFSNMSPLVAEVGNT